MGEGGGVMSGYFSLPVYLHHPLTISQQSRLQGALSRLLIIIHTAEIFHSALLLVEFQLQSSQSGES